MNKKQKILLTIIGIIIIGITAEIALLSWLSSTTSTEKVCYDTCDKVGTNILTDNTTGEKYNYTEPHGALYEPNSKYCLCLFQGNNRIFTFNAEIKELYDKQKEVRS